MAKPDPRKHTVLVTGATDGIGLLLAKSYAARGHHVLATGRRSVEGDEAFFGTSRITYIRADQESPKLAAQTIASAMRDMGWTQLDLAILNGAMGWTGDPAEELPAHIARQIDVNLTAPIIISQALGPWLFVGKGKLVFVGSTVVKKGQGAFATYAATKAGLAGFVRSLRSEWDERADVMIVHPGPTRTAMHEKAGLKTGLVRMFFMSPKRAAKAIQLAVRKGDRQRFLTRRFGWRALLSGAKEGQL